MMPTTWKELPEDDPIFGGPHFVFYAGPLLTSEELKAAHRITPAEDDVVEFVSPRIPGRMQRGPLTPPVEKSEGE